MKKITPSRGHIKPQMMFDIVYAHFTKPGAQRALDENGLGVYVTNDGRKCPIGLLLGDGQCHKIKDSHIKGHHLVNMSHKCQELAARLQLWHDRTPDGSTPVDISDCDIKDLEHIAAGFGLTIPERAA